MINKTLSILAGGLFVAVAAALAGLLASWWLLPFAISSGWLGCLLIADAFSSPRSALPAAAPIRTPEGPDAEKAAESSTSRLAA
jgi:hypothetical protein